jgi:hypothetical protein
MRRLYIKRNGLFERKGGREEDEIDCCRIFQNIKGYTFQAFHVPLQGYI